MYKFRCLFLLVGLVLALSACGTRGVEVEVVNEGDRSVQAVTFGFANQSYTVSGISPGERLSERWEGIEQQGGDGQYTLEVTFADGSLFDKRYGYYTNGYPGADAIQVAIGDSSLTVVQSEHWGTTQDEYLLTTGELVRGGVIETSSSY